MTGTSATSGMSDPASVLAMLLSVILPFTVNTVPVHPHAGLVCPGDLPVRLPGFF